MEQYITEFTAKNIDGQQLMLLDSDRLKVRSCVQITQSRHYQGSHHFVQYLIHKNDTKSRYCERPDWRWIKQMNFSAVLLFYPLCIEGHCHSETIYTAAYSRLGLWQNQPLLASIFCWCLRGLCCKKLWSFFAIYMGFFTLGMRVKIPLLLVTLPARWRVVCMVLSFAPFSLEKAVLYLQRRHWDLLLVMYSKFKGEGSALQRSAGIRSLVVLCTACQQN